MRSGIAAIRKLDAFGLRRILELLRVQAPHLLGHREVKFAVRIVLWLGAIALTIFGLLLMAGALDSSGSDAAGRGLSQAYGMFIALLGGAAVLSLLLTRFWRGFLVIGGLFLSLPFVLILLLSIGRTAALHCLPCARRSLNLKSDSGSSARRRFLLRRDRRRIQQPAGCDTDGLSDVTG
jgi:magnesium-transporting ATPase (P-type)